VKDDGEGFLPLCRVQLFDLAELGEALGDAVPDGDLRFRLGVAAEAVLLLGEGPGVNVGEGLADVLLDEVEDLAIEWRVPVFGGGVDLCGVHPGEANVFDVDLDHAWGELGGGDEPGLSGAEVVDAGHLAHRGRGMMPEGVGGGQAGIEWSGDADLAGDEQPAAGAVPGRSACRI
jgi:hypothetical protein